MIKKIFNVFTKKEKKTFSGFFREATLEDKKKLLEEVVRKANQDQRDIIKRYDRIQTKITL